MGEWMHRSTFGTSWSWVVSFTPRLLYPWGKRPQYQLDRRLGGPQSRSGQHGEKKIFDPTGTQTPTPQSSSPEPVKSKSKHSVLLTHSSWRELYTIFCISWNISVCVDHMHARTYSHTHTHTNRLYIITYSLDIYIWYSYHFYYIHRMCKNYFVRVEMNS
jgi:hypothetical protein